MTKPWDLHEATIKKLYAEHTLAEVRQTMIDKYNFSASTRAYRGRLIKWGVRKYNCRRRSDCASISAGSPDGSVSGSDITSPTLSQPTVEASHDLTRYSTSGHGRDDERRAPNLSYNNALGMDTRRTYTENYGRAGPPVPATQKIYAWDTTTIQPASPPTTYSPANMVGTPGQIYGYPPLSPTSSTYSSTIYDSGQTERDRRESFPLMPIPRHYDAIHDGSDYSQLRDYGHGHRNADMGPYYGIRDQVTKHSPAG
ncbi:hypothetical protein F5Y10DRAFT_255108 [Nemania abortiva]|nr:hypothetical protein F5Y10DRAFT_255108 [Nemania abortiva]